MTLLSHREYRTLEAAVNLSALQSRVSESSSATNHYVNTCQFVQLL